jgi:hypothetical protein
VRTLLLYKHAIVPMTLRSGTYFTQAYIWSSLAPDGRATVQ